MSKSRQTKIDKVTAMLRRPAGATLEALCKATGWQPHSARAALSTLRKKGAEIERRPSETRGGPSSYHLVAGQEAR
ncbi:DUF3489 domain-containing protein [Ruegeria marina]|uniref:DUF3489 domain-containing protein n=1 Tax=Ruegeria marina TaxID=639004 RepID=A0A1G6VAS9_9RHOB|nr:DUF3489 domain-containing protein [Ruegeria marina]SDD50810.1 Protein of unknown function [Ruegeria marina]